LSTSGFGKTIAIAVRRENPDHCPCPRCVMTDAAQGDSAKDPGHLETAARHNRVHIRRAYASVVRAVMCVSAMRQHRLRTRAPARPNLGLQPVPRYERRAGIAVSREHIDLSDSIAGCLFGAEPRASPSGALADDRRFAMIDRSGKYVNAKRNGAYSYCV